jgi:hypothetical protein
MKTPFHMSSFREKERSPSNLQSNGIHTIHPESQITVTWTKDALTVDAVLVGCLRAEIVLATN